MEKSIKRKTSGIFSLIMAFLVGIMGFVPLQAKADDPAFSNVGSFDLDTTNANTVKDVFPVGNYFYALEGQSDNTYKLHQYTNTADSSENFADENQYTLTEKDGSTPFTFDDAHYASSGITDCDISEDDPSPVIYAETSGTGSSGAATYIYSFDLNGKEINGWDASTLTGLTGYNVADLKETPDGGFVLLMKSGTTQDDGHYDYYLYKFDSSGNKISSADVKQDILTIPIYTKYETSASFSVNMLIDVFSDGRIALFPQCTKSTSGLASYLSKVLIYDTADDNITLNQDQIVNFGKIVSNTLVSSVFPVDGGVAIFSSNQVSGTGISLQTFSYSDSTSTAFTSTGIQSLSDSNVSNNFVVMHGTADNPVMFGIGNSYTGGFTNKINVYINPNAGMPKPPETPLPTNETATNSVTTWQPAGQFKNANFAVDNVARAGGYNYILQKDGDSHIKMVRYLGKVGADGNYDVDSTFTPFDLKDKDGNLLDFNSSDSGYVKLISFDVSSDGDIYVSVEDGKPGSDNSQNDHTYIYGNDGSYKNVIIHTARTAVANNDGSGVQSVRALPNGKLAVFYYSPLLLVAVYDENGMQLSEIDSGSSTAVNHTFNKLNPSHVGYGDGDYANLFYPYMGVDSSGTFGLLKRHAGANTAWANYLTADTFDSDLTKVTGDDDIKETNFPLPDGYSLGGIPDSIAGIIPTSIGAIVAQNETQDILDSDGNVEKTVVKSVNLDEYNAYDGTKGNQNKSIWQTSFEPAGESIASTLSGTETDPVVYSYGSDGQTIYVEGLEGSDTVKAGTYEFTIDSSGTLIKYTGNDENVVIPDTVKSIGDGAFKGNTTIKSITIPNTVTSIGDNAFNGCTSLTSVLVPNSVTGIGDSAFSDDTVLASVTIPDSVKTIGTDAFSGDDNLTITGAAGSEAETYAKDNNITFTEDTAPVISLSSYDDSTPTNNDITVTATTDKGVFEDSGKTTSTHTFTENGTYTFTASDGIGTVSKPVTINNIDKSLVTSARFGGADRYATSAKIAEGNWKKGDTDTAVVVSGQAFPDALSAAPLAKQHNAPIILTTGSSLDSNAEQTLKDLGISNVYIVGGTGVVSQNVENYMKNTMNITIKARMGGADRYATSLLVAQQFIKDSNGVNPPNVFITAGSGYADSLSVASYAAASGSPIILSSVNSLSSGAQSFIHDRVNGGSKVYVIGGTGVISNGAVLPISNYTTYQRIWGADRYATNLAVLNAFAGEYTNANLYLASASGFADALSGSAAAAMQGAPILLVSNAASQPANTYTYLKSIASNVKNMEVLGGQASVTDAVKNNIINSLQSYKK